MGAVAGSLTLHPPYTSRYSATPSAYMSNIGIVIALPPHTAPILIHHIHCAACITLCRTLHRTPKLHTVCDRAAPPLRSNATTKRSAPWCQKTDAVFATIAHRAMVQHSSGLPIECDLTKSARFGEHKERSGRACGTRNKRNEKQIVSAYSGLKGGSVERVTLRIKLQ